MLYSVSDLQGELCMLFFILYFATIFHGIALGCLDGSGGSKVLQQPVFQVSIAHFHGQKKTFHLYAWNLLSQRMATTIQILFHCTKSSELDSS